MTEDEIMKHIAGLEITNIKLRDKISAIIWKIDTAEITTRVDAVKELRRALEIK